jgi:putative transposase
LRSLSATSKIPGVSVLSFKYRIRSGARHLRRHAIACNQVWNFCVSTQRESERRWKGDKRAPYLGAFDFVRLTTGAAADLGLHSDTVNQICRQFTKARDTKRKCPKFRASFGSKRALGWLPFIPRATKIDGDAAIYLKRRFRFWKSRDVEGEYRAGNFVEDARGRWYVVFQCEVPDNLDAGSAVVGIDLGLKELAALSTGEKIPAIQHYRRYEAKLAVAQRARNKKRSRAIHAKIANARRHHLHEQSNRIVQGNRLIAVGNVSPSKLAKTRMAKSILDASWSSFRHMLRYKAARRQAVYVDVDERWTSQVCSACGAMPPERPKGIADLGMRAWECSGCGTFHDRDVNAARNILRLGLEHQPPAGGIVAL